MSPTLFEPLAQASQQNKSQKGIEEGEHIIGLFVDDVFIILEINVSPCW